jgi:hypothetical protein
MNDNQDAPALSPLRSAVCFVVALALMLGGLYLLIGLLISPQPVKMLAFFAAAIMAAAGACWLWSDFIRVLWGNRPG